MMPPAVLGARGRGQVSPESRAQAEGRGLDWPLQWPHTDPLGLVGQAGLVGGSSVPASWPRPPVTCQYPGQHVEVQTLSTLGSVWWCMSSRTQADIWSLLGIPREPLALRQPQREGVRVVLAEPMVPSVCLWVPYSDLRLLLPTWLPRSTPNSAGEEGGVQRGPRPPATWEPMRRMSLMPLSVLRGPRPPQNGHLVQLAWAGWGCRP